MMHWLSVNWASIVVGLALAALLAGVILNMIKNKKNNKSACGCSCAGCPGANICRRG